MFEVRRIIPLVLLKYVVAHLGEKVGVGIGCFYLMCCEPLAPKNIVMRLNNVRLHHSRYVVSLVIQSYTKLEL